MNRMIELMEVTARALPPDQHTKAEFERIVRDRLRDLTPGTGAPRQCLYRMRYVCKRIKGLSLDCIKAIKSPGFRRTSAVELRFTDEEVAIMYRNLPRATNSVRILFWKGASGAQHWRDVMFMKWSEVDEWRDSLCSDRRTKTGRPYMQYVWPEVFECLNAEEREPGDVYVCKHLVHGVRELANDPLCNKRELTPKEEAERADVVRQRANQEFQAFLELCGIRRDGLSYKSFRHYNASIGKAAQFPLEVILHYLGLSSAKTLGIYAHALPAQIVGLGVFLREHYKAVVKGESPSFVTSLTEVVRVLSSAYHDSTEVLRKEVGELRSLVAAVLERLGSSVTKEPQNPPSESTGPA